MEFDSKTSFRKTNWHQSKIIYQNNKRTILYNNFSNAVITYLTNSISYFSTKCMIIDGRNNNAFVGIVLNWILTFLDNIL